MLDVRGRWGLQGREPWRVFKSFELLLIVARAFGAYTTVGRPFTEKESK